MAKLTRFKWIAALSAVSTTCIISFLILSGLVWAAQAIPDNGFIIPVIPISYTDTFQEPGNQESPFLDPLSYSTRVSVQISILFIFQYFY